MELLGEGRIRPVVDERTFPLDEWLAWLDLQIDNVRAALQWCLAQAEHRALAKRRGRSLPHNGEFIDVVAVRVAVGAV